MAKEKKKKKKKKFVGRGIPGAFLVFSAEPELEREIPAYIDCISNFIVDGTELITFTPSLPDYTIDDSYPIPGIFPFTFSIELYLSAMPDDPAPEIDVDITINKGGVPTTVTIPVIILP